MERKIHGKLMTRTVVIPLLMTSLLSHSACGFIVFNHRGSDTTAVTTAGGTTAGTTAPTTDTETTADPHDKSLARLAALPDRDLSASSVIIATTDSETICPTVSDDEVVASRAAITRDVEKKYNTLIISDTQDAEAILTAAKEAYASDMYYADLLAVPQSMLGSLYASGILANMESLPFTDYTNAYYDQNLISEAVMGNQLLAVSGAANFNPEYLSCIYFNRSLIEAYGLENPYDLVDAGTWTWDKLRELSRAVADDLNTDYSGYGFELSRADMIDLAASSMGIDYVSNPKGQVPAVTFMADETFAARAKGIVDTLYGLLFSDGSAVPEKQSARELFTAGSLLFYTDRLYVTTWLPDSTINWGILPFPKYDAAQEGYLSPLASDAPIFAALANTPNYDTSGLILEALNAAAYEYTRDVYLNNRINYYLRDNGSIAMLERIVGGATGDFAHMTASGFPTLANATYSAITTAVTSKSTLAALDKKYRATADKELSASVILYE